MNEGKASPADENGQKPRQVKKIAEMRVNFNLKNVFLWLFIFIIGISVFLSFQSSTKNQEEKPISAIIADAKNGSVKQIVVEDSKLTVTYKNGQVFTSHKEPQESLITDFERSGVNPDSVQIQVQDTSMAGAWLNILSTVLPLVLMVAFFFFLFRQARGAQDTLFSFGQSKARLFNRDNPKVTFTDVAGVDEAKQELSEVVDFLKHPGKYRSLGARTPKGVLLIGPAGTGKTLLARAVAGEANVAFFSMAGSEFMEMLVGVGASRVRDLFNTAKKNAPSIIFIDEIDAIGRMRTTGVMGGHDEREQTLNQILVEMDGFTPNENVIVIAATNRGDLLDPALLRPGRFDRRVILDMPDIEGRKNILSIHMRGKPFVKEVEWDKVARRTVGFSGADLENMLNEAAILAARSGKKAIDMVDIEEAATKVKLGPEKKRLQSDLDKKMTAYHEAGHAIVTHELPHMDPVHRISIVSRGLALGFTLIPPVKDRYTETKSHLIEQMASLLGGRAAESLIFNEFTAGAASDISKATEIARTMVVEYGMSELGPVNWGPQVDISDMGRAFYEPSQISPDMSGKIDGEINKFISQAYATAQEILKKTKEKLDLVAGELVKKETIEGDEFERLMSGKKVAPAVVKA